MAESDEHAHCLSMRYRYRTTVLLGAWQNSAHMATAAAIRAGQARRADDGSIIWRVPGSIEAVEDERAASRAA
jgi:hypothetical protein